jgi:hypothetical protein
MKYGGGGFESHLPQPTNIQLTMLERAAFTFRQSCHVG